MKDLNDITEIVKRSRLLFEEPRRLVDPFTWMGHIPFAFFITEFMKPRLIVELGVHSGNSFNAFCQAVDRLQLPAQCYGIDNWKGDHQAGKIHETIYNDLKKYQADHYAGFSGLLRMDFSEGKSHFSEKSIDLLHIDGLHTYEAVKRDFEEWLPLMSDRSVVLVHDTMVKFRDFGVWRFWEEMSMKYPSFEFHHGFGLGILKTGILADERLFTMDEEQQGKTRNIFRRSGSGLVMKYALEELVKLPGFKKISPNLCQGLIRQSEEEEDIIRVMEYLRRKKQRQYVRRGLRFLKR